MSYLNKTLNTYFKELSSSKPTPGGGSAAAVVASMGVSLSMMVAQVFAERKGANKTVAKQQQIVKNIYRDLKVLQKSIVKIIDEDTKMYQKVVSAYKLPKTQKLRVVRIEKALCASYQTMRNLCSDLCAMKRLNKDLVKRVKGAIANDLLVSQQFIAAAFRSAYDTAQINLVYMDDEVEQKKLEKELSNLNKVFGK